MPRGATLARRGVVALLTLVAVAACDNDDGAAADVVGPAEAITAAVEWQAGEQEPVIDDNGEEQLPVIFVVADGATIEVGVQADVAASAVDWATVRFADDVADVFDPDLDGEPVRDDGVLLLIGAMPEPAQRVELGLVRYAAVDDGEPITLEITAASRTDGTEPDAMPRAIVTAVTQP